MNKAEIHASYMEQQKALHAGWPRRAKQRVGITGSANPTSIGAAIARQLVGDFSIDEFKGDVRYCAELNEWLTSKPLDALVMCHGVTHLDWFEDAPLEKMREIFDVNLYGSALAARQFVKATLELPWRKTIVMIGSMAHKAVLNGSAAYCASKAGLAHLARCLAWELAPKGYDVFIIHPSNTEGTPMTEETIRGLMRYRNLTRAEAEAYWGASLPRAAWLQPEDIARLVRALLAGEMDYLSGTQIDLGGGQR